MSTRAFLDRLFAACTGGVVEVRAYPSGARTWVAPGDWHELGPFITAQVRAGQNVALGIATRKDTTNGTGANLYEVPALVADLDQAPAKAGAKLTRIPFRPSWIVGTGAHIHAYYLLREATNMEDPVESVRLGSVQRRLAAHLDADVQATDAARVWRLPGTVSFKYGEPRPVTILEQSDTTLNLSELDDVLPRLVVRHGKRVLENRLEEGRRNDHLYGIARSLRFRGVPPRVLVPALELINAEWCDPPLPHDELMALLRYAIVGRDAPDFLARHTPVDIEHDAEPDRRQG